jgi:hypothetical protein
MAGRRFYPLLAVLLLDEQGMEEIQEQRSVSRTYLSALGVENSTSFTVNTLRSPGTYYLLLSNALPWAAAVDVTVLEEWGEWALNANAIPLLAAGPASALAGLMIRRRRED